MIHRNGLALAGLSVLLIAGCGGDGSGGGTSASDVPTEPVTVTAVNAVPITATVTATILRAAEVQGSVAASAAGDTTTDATDLRSLAAVLRRAALLTQPAVPTPVTVRAVAGSTTTCDQDRGTASISIDDADASGDLTAGDIVTLAFTDCLLGADVVDGSLSLTLLFDPIGDPFAGPEGAWSLTAFVATTGLTLERSDAITGGGTLTSVEGTLTLEASNDPTADRRVNRIAGTSLTLTRRSPDPGLIDAPFISAARFLDFDVTFVDGPGLAYAVELDLVLASTALGGSVAAAGLLEGLGEQNPATGTLEILGAPPSRMTVVIQGSLVTIGVDENGDGVAETVLAALEWAELGL